MGSTPPDRQELEGIREIASRESADIVLDAAARIERLLADAEAELRVLKGTIDAAAPGHDSAAILPVSEPARAAVDEARRALDRFAEELRTASGGARRLRFRTRPVLLAGTALILTAGTLGIATGLLSITNRAETTSSGATATADGSKATAAGAAAPKTNGAEELRERAVSWLQDYMSGRQVSQEARSAAPVVRDERTASERITTPAAHRTITPARIDIFGDAAVISASVTEQSPEGRELVSLVSQVWTRTGGDWQLDDVRIVSASDAAQAFRR